MKRRVEALEQSNSQEANTLKRLRIFKENGSTNNSGFGDSNHQSKTRTEEEEGKEKAKKGRGPDESGGEFKDCKSTSSSEGEDGSSRDAGFKGDTLSSLATHEKEDLPNSMPYRFQMLAETGYKESDCVREASKDKSKSGRDPEGVCTDEDFVHRHWANSIKVAESKIDTWENLQKIAFEMTGDAQIYVPGQDPRDFNVLWRNYVKQLNGIIVRTPLISEPGPDYNREPIMYQAHMDSNQFSHNQNSEKVEHIQLDVKNNESVPEVESLPDYDGEDEELDLFLEMDIDQRIMKLNIFLRSELYFCIYCGHRYRNEEQLFENCPGLTENDHK